jgi:hypothetical protein
VSTTPFGSDVVPEVNMTASRSVGATAATTEYHPPAPAAGVTSSAVSVSSIVGSRPAADSATPAAYTSDRLAAQIPAAGRTRSSCLPISRAVDVGSTGTSHAPDRAQASQIAMKAGQLRSTTWTDDPAVTPAAASVAPMRTTISWNSR